MNIFRKPAVLIATLMLSAMPLLAYVPNLPAAFYDYSVQALSILHREPHPIALTDANGNLPDQFAYTPYGELIKHTGTTQPPYTFCGRHLRRFRQAMA